jgi:hypothetical protein
VDKEINLNSVIYVADKEIGFVGRGKTAREGSKVRRRVSKQTQELRWTMHEDDRWPLSFGASDPGSDKEMATTPPCIVCSPVCLTTHGGA